MKDIYQPQPPASGVDRGSVGRGPGGVNNFETKGRRGVRKKVVIVGLGMVGINFM